MNKIKRFNTEYIDDYIKENKISKAEFCRRCGITYNCLKSIYLQKNVTIITPFKIVFFLKIKMNDFLC